MGLGMNTHDSDQKNELEKLTVPVAIVHQGAFVHANSSFLGVFGLASREDLNSLLFLDLVDARDHERARFLLSDGLNHSPMEEPGASQVVRLQSSYDGLKEVTISACRTRFEGEECVQIELHRIAGRSFFQRAAELPWRLYLSVAFVVLFTLVPMALLTKLKINNTPEVYFPDDQPAVLIDKALRERFPNDQVFVLLFEGVALFSEGVLKSLDELGSKVRGMEKVDDVISLTRLDHISGTEDGFNVEPLLNPERLGETRWPDKLAKATQDRFASRQLVAPDGSAMAMVVVPGTLSDSFQRLALYEAILTEVEAVALSGHLKGMAGQMAVDVEMLRSMLKDNSRFIPATMGIGLLLVWLMFRRVLAVVITGLALGVVTNSTVALYAVLGEPFTLTSTIIPPLLSALTIAALIHLFNAVQYASRRGFIGRERVERALQEVRRPALFTMLTTVAGLASLGTSPIVPTATLGILSAGGVVLVYVVAIVVCPTFIVRWDHRPWPKKQIGLRWSDSLVQSLSSYAIRHPIAVVLLVLGVLVVGATQISRVVVETNLLRFFHPDHSVRVTTDRIDQKLVGTNSLNIVFEAAEKDGLLEPDRLRRLKEFQVWAETLPEVDKSLSIVDFVEEMHWGFNAEDPAFRAIPNDRRLISQYIFVYDGDDLWDYVDRDLRTALIPLNVNVHLANETSALMVKIRDYFSDHLPVDDSVKVEIGGFGRQLADMEDLIIVGQVRSLWGALVLIMILMIIEWRSVRDALLCMVPNLAPVFLIFTFMGLFGIWLDIATAMIASVAVGIAVDDTIHIYHGFISRQKRHGNTTWALARTYRQAGRAITTTTLVLCAQFLILTTSGFVPTAHFGLLTSVGLVAAWLFDVVLLPAIIMLVFRGRSVTSQRKAELIPR